MTEKKAPVVMIVMDGFGLAKPGKGNAIWRAKPKNFNHYWKKYPHTTFLPIGENVGLLGDTQGNSEVGHIHLGAGRVVWQSLPIIDRAIKNKSFYKNKALLKAVKNAKKYNTQFHVIGLCSDEGVHAELDHLCAVLELAAKHKLKKVFIHCILDGRDVPERSAAKYIKRIQKKCKQLKIGKIASIIGRFYAMDRSRNWDRTLKAYKLITEGKGVKETDPVKAIKKAYQKGAKTDYYVPATVLVEENQPMAVVQKNDSVVFTNFRTDRARQLSRPFVDKKFKHFKVKKERVCFVGMTQYDPNMKQNTAFLQETVKNNLGHVLAKNRLKQFRIAEADKYAHVTFFFNSQINKPEKGEDRFRILSDRRVKSFDLKPGMEANKIAKKATAVIRKKKYDFVLVNFANADVVGHAGKINAVVKAIKVVDKNVGKIVANALKTGATVILTADHGNAEEMFYPNGDVKPSHSHNPVPLILMSNNPELQKIKLRKHVKPTDVAPTILALLSLKKPKEMTGKSVIVGFK